MTLPSKERRDQASSNETDDSTRRICSLESCWLFIAGSICFLPVLKAVICLLADQDIEFTILPDMADLAHIFSLSFLFLSSFIPVERRFTEARWSIVCKSILVFALSKVCSYFVFSQVKISDRLGLAKIVIGFAGQSFLIIAVYWSFSFNKPFSVSKTSFAENETSFAENETSFAENETSQRPTPRRKSVADKSDNEHSFSSSRRRSTSGSGDDSLVQPSDHEDEKSGEEKKLTNSDTDDDDGKDENATSFKENDADSVKIGRCHYCCRTFLRRLFAPDPNGDNRWTLADYA